MYPGWTESLTYISLFMVLDEFAELKVPSDDRHLEARMGRAQTVSRKLQLMR